MKITLALCVTAFSTSLWLAPAVAVAVDVTKRRFLADSGDRSNEALAGGSRFLPLAQVLADEAAKKAAEDAQKAAEEAAKAAEAARLAALKKPVPAPAPAPAPAPLPAPMPAPVTPPPIPPCNWTYDWEGVARPADCTNLTDGNHTCVRGNMTFPDEDIECYAPPLARCERPDKHQGFPIDYIDFQVVELYAVQGEQLDAGGMDDDTIKHGIEFEILCSDNATAIETRYPLESWNQDWYPGVQRVSAVCNNGTIIRADPTNITYWLGHPAYRPAGIKPIGLHCVLKEKVDLTQDIISYLRWTEPRMHEAETKGYRWIDMQAIMHKTLLRQAMDESAKIEVEARDLGELQDIPVLKRVRQALIDNRMLPRGEPVTQETCKDLEAHWLYQLKNSDPFKKANKIGYANWVPPVNATIGFPLASDIKLERPIDLTCSYTLQKAGVGADPISRVMNYRYRDGCFCESRWIGGCPFKLEFSPSYQTFGFDALETKGVSTGMGAATNALCWYMTKPANPEWGYLRTTTGFDYQAPAQNVTELKRDWIELKKKAQAARFKRR
jgi:hypothetical protein